jgi:hypothetical protein
MLDLVFIMFFVLHIHLGLPIWTPAHDQRGVFLTLYLSDKFASPSFHLEQSWKIDQMSNITPWFGLSCCMKAGGSGTNWTPLSLAEKIVSD